MAEPIFHFFDDSLPDDHYLLQFQSLHCLDCQTMVHCINEVMTAWLETGIGIMCLQCFTKRYTEQDNVWTFEELEIDNG
jgi:hypothetical protein